MIYVTAKISPKIKQMTIEDLLFAKFTEFNRQDNKNETNTRTFSTVKVPENYLTSAKNVSLMVGRLREFNDKYDFLRNVPREELYHRFFIPKKSGGLRQIDAPNDDLKKALAELKSIFEDEFHALYHTSAFAYIKGRSTVDALKKHQMNKSMWFEKLDISNFFGSTTQDFIMKMLGIVFPFSEIVEWEDGKEQLTKAVELGILNGGLPQGTPLSPTLTNIIMIPIDFEFGRAMREKDQKFICTRYADDFLISSRYDFNPREIENVLRDVMRAFEAPYLIKEEKTRYGSRAGQNWNLGLMLNANNEITIGHKRKREFKAMLTNYILDTKNGKAWDNSDVQVMDGYRAYYEQVEKENIRNIITHLDEKFNVDVMSMIKNQLYAKEI